MTDFSQRVNLLETRIYQFIVIACGISVVAANIGKITFRDWQEVIVFMVFYSLALLLPARLPQGDVFSVSVFADMALLGIFGVQLAICGVFLVTFISRLITSFVTKQETLLNTVGFSAQSSLVIGVTGITYVLSGYSGWGFAVAALMYFLSNALFLNINSRLFKKKTLELGWDSGANVVFINYIVLAVMAYIMTIIYNNISTDWKMFNILLFFVPILLVSHAFRLYINTKQSYMNTVKAIVAAIEANDSYTKGHSERVAGLVPALGKTLGLPERDLQQLEYLAFLHDVGKIGISDTILKKPSGLSSEEYETIKNHSRLGADILKKVHFLSSKADVILYHHERFDGKGYPVGLKGEEIPIEARILAVADAYDAMTSDRPYRQAKEPAEAIEEINKMAGTQFDPQMVEALKKVLSDAR